MNKKVISIKDIAHETNVSITTASVVINGKGNEMRISEKTQKKVLEVSASLGYRPNIFARRLRNKNKNQVPLIAILWTLDNRTSLVSRFLRGIQEPIVYNLTDFDILIQPYKNNQIHMVESLKTGNSFNGAVIANASNKDIEYLEKSKLGIPVVLYQRNSKILNSVNSDDFKTGSEVARLFSERGHNKVALIVPEVPSQAVRDRLSGFKSQAKKLSLNLTQENIIYNEFSEEGGYLAGNQLIKNEKLPTAVFCLSDEMATGALASFYEGNIKIPEDLEIIGHDNNVQTKFTIPSLSTVHLPVEEMGRDSIRVILDILEYQVDEPVNLSYDSKFVFRKSCGGFAENNI